MPLKCKITQEDKIIIGKRLSKGETYQFIANDYDLSRERIRQIAYSMGLDREGIRIRRENKHKDWLNKMGKRYGEFFNGSDVVERDLLYECKLRYQVKKNNAKRTGVEFSVEFQDIIWNKICPILEIEIDYFADGRQENSPSFDRTDPSKGYIKGNVQIISWRANRIKNDGTREEHLAIVKYIQSSMSTTISI